MIPQNATRSLLRIASFAPALWATSCSPTDPSLVTPTAAGVRIVESADPGPADPFEVVGYSLDGDILKIDVSYSGGCETHEFVGLVGSAIGESFPVQMWGRIAHDDRNDPCDSIVQGTISLDLSPIRELYRGSYGVGAATVVLNLSPIEQAIPYSF